MPETNSTSWEIGGTRVVRFEDFTRQRQAERERLVEAHREAHRRYIEAQQAYSESLRALGSMAHPGVRGSDITMTGSAAPSVASGAVATAAAARPQDELTDHNYDGIQEYDNPTPSWWWWIFAATIGYSVFHVALVHFTPDSVWKLPNERHAAVEAAALERQFAELNQIPMGEEKILRIMAQASWLDQGASIYKGTCALCHGEQGQGLIGPNLTDNVYKTENVATLMDIPRVVAEGSANAQMPAQKNFLNENEIALVAAYVASLRGKDLEGPRGPEGEPIPSWPTLTDEGTVEPAPGGGAGEGEQNVTTIGN